MMKSIRQAIDLTSALTILPLPRAIVPTMGALHEGHLTLIRQARKAVGEQGSVIVTVFINPTQFDKAGDMESYPRTLETDFDLCQSHGVDLVFAPDPASMYLPDSSVTVSERSLSGKLCGATRPGHFDGVCTVVLKLFNLIQPDIAVFGEKDYQQLSIIRRMVRDFNIPVRIESVETVREASGLALSSRNTRLTTAQHTDARRIRRALLAAKDAHQNGETSAAALLDIARKEIECTRAGAHIDYIELLDTASLNTVNPVTTPSIMATAVFYGEIRLIDNIRLGNLEFSK